jgi:hypothetical protein
VENNLLADGIDKSFLKYLIITRENIENFFIYLLYIIFINNILINFINKHARFFAEKKNYYNYKKFEYALATLFLKIRIKKIIKYNGFTFIFNG